jgi:hypothetical protein
MEESEYNPHRLCLIYCPVGNCLTYRNMNRQYFCFFHLDKQKYSIIKGPTKPHISCTEKYLCMKANWDEREGIMS